MKFIRPVAPLLLCSFALPLVFAAPQPEASLATGHALFRSNCAFCHGLDAKGGRGPSLMSNRVSREITDPAFVYIIRHGIAGTSMPSFEMEEPEAIAIVQYVRSLVGTGAPAEIVPGDPAQGKRVYDSSGCASCHRIGETGGIFGPELTRIGGARSVAYLRTSITDPSADVQPEYETVTVVTKDGKKISGIRVNEDTFTVQLRLQNEKFAMFKKDEVRSVTAETRSLMPAYDKLSPVKLDDLIAYLVTLRGATPTSDVTQIKGIH